MSVALAKRIKLVKQIANEYKKTRKDAIIKSLITDQTLDTSYNFMNKQDVSQNALDTLDISKQPLTYNNGDNDLFLIRNLTSVIDEWGGSFANHPQVIAEAAGSLKNRTSGNWYPVGNGRIQEYGLTAVTSAFKDLSNNDSGWTNKISIKQAVKWCINKGLLPGVDVKYILIKDTAGFRHTNDAAFFLEAIGFAQASSIRSDYNQQWKHYNRCTAAVHKWNNYSHNRVILFPRNIDLATFFYTRMENNRINKIVTNSNNWILENFKDINDALVWVKAEKKKQDDNKTAEEKAAEEKLEREKLIKEALAKAEKAKETAQQITTMSKSINTNYQLFKTGTNNMTHRFIYFNPVGAGNGYFLEQQLNIGWRWINTNGHLSKGDDTNGTEKWVIKDILNHNTNSQIIVVHNTQFASSKKYSLLFFPPNGFYKFPGWMTSDDIFNILNAGLDNTYLVSKKGVWQQRPDNIIDKENSSRSTFIDHLSHK